MDILRIEYVNGKIEKNPMTNIVDFTFVGI